jgi:hypothetical protein
MAILWILTVIECNISIVCACLPGLQPLLLAISPDALRATDPRIRNYRGDPFQPNYSISTNSRYSQKDGEARLDYPSMQMFRPGVLDTFDAGRSPSYVTWATGGGSVDIAVPERGIAYTRDIYIDAARRESLASEARTLEREGSITRPPSTAPATTPEGTMESDSYVLPPIEPSRSPWSFRLDNIGEADEKQQ